MAQEKPDWVKNSEIAKYGHELGSSSGSGSTSAPASTPTSTPKSSSGSSGYVAKDPQGVDNYHAKYTANEGQGMSASDQATLKSYGDAWNAANAEYQKAVAEGRDGSQYKAQMDQAHKDAEALRGQYGYRGGEDGSEYIPDPAPVPQQQVTRAPSLEAPDFTGLLNSWLETAKKQQELGIDYATNKGVNDLQRAEEDAQEMFQTQQDQVSKDEAKALDNQALYAEARGDRGGIGHAQYGQIQATAMTNRRAVNSARTKLATDTARQIADLRAQGEFQKADALLELTQTYLGQLIDLQKWGAEYALDVAQFETQLQQWQAEFELAVSDVTGMYQGSPTMSAQKANQSILASSGKAALAVGIRPSPEQQVAMGYTDAQIEAELAAYQLAMSAGVSYSGGGGNPKPKDDDNTGTPSLEDIYMSMYREGIKTEAKAEYYLENVAKVKGTVENYIYEYMAGLEDGSLAEAVMWEDAEVDMQQATKLFGPVTEEWLAAQVASGDVETYLSGGKIRFRKVEKQGVPTPITSFSEILATLKGGL